MSSKTQEEVIEELQHDNKLLREQVQHLLRENGGQKEQLRSMSQRLVQAKWKLNQLTVRR